MKSAISSALAILLLHAASAAAQDSLAPVRDLYASAEYERALTALGDLRSSPDSGGLVEVDRYRVLCLIALGRATEADKVIETIVTGDPLYQPAAADAAPRVRAAFTAVRRRVLPTLVRGLYANAKAAFDRKEFPEAAAGLEKTLRVIDEVDTGNQDLGDLRVLASGFLDLSRASLAKVQAPASPAPALSPPTVVNNIKEPAITPAAPLPFSNVVAIRQPLPPLPFSLAKTSGEYRGAIELDIDEAGNVVVARLLQSVHVLYDPILLKAASDWKYEPARIDGRPTGGKKRVEIVVRP
jgi:hypothetical protein